MKGSVIMYIILYRNHSDDRTYDYTDFAIFLNRNELKDFIDNLEYPADYRTFYATETFEYRKEL